MLVQYEKLFAVLKIKPTALKPPNFGISNIKVKNIGYSSSHLIGNYAGFRDCHIEPDWVLIYKKIDEPEPVLHLEATGSHSDLF